jgi:flagellar biogenesis protein FliO
MDRTFSPAGYLCLFGTLALLAGLGAVSKGDDSGTTGELLRSGGVTSISDEPAVKASAPTLSPAIIETATSVPTNEPAAEPRPTAPVKSKGDRKPIPLASRKENEKAAPAKAALAKPTESLITVGGSLCVVLSLFFGVAWITRRGLPKQLGKLPGEVIEVLGKAPLVKGQDLQLVRVGTKLLLICVTPTGCETLTEITDDAEVERLAAVCRRSNPSSMTAAFNDVLTGIGREPASGFAGAVRTPPDRRGGRHASR